MKYLVEIYGIFSPKLWEETDFTKYNILGSRKGKARKFDEGLLEGTVEYVVRARSKKLASELALNYVKSHGSTQLALVNRVSTLPRDYEWETWI